LSSRWSGLGPHYWRLLASSTASNLADGVFQIAVPLLAVSLTRSPIQVAGVALAARLPWLLFTLHAGAIADRVDRRRVMLSVEAARTLIIAGFAAAVAADVEGLPLLYAVALVLGIGETLYDTSAQSLMPMLVAPANLERGNGALQTSELVMNEFVGPPLGGLLAAVALSLAFATSAAVYAVAVAALLLVTGSYRVERRVHRPMRVEIAEGIRYLMGHRLLRSLAFMLGAMNMASTAVYAILPLYAVAPGPMGLSSFGFGVLLTSFAAGGALGGLATARVVAAAGRSRVLFLAVVCEAVALAVPAATSEAWVVGPVIAVGGFMTAMWNVLTVSLRQRIIPPPLFGRVNSCYRLFGWGAMPLGAVLGGALAQAAGVRSVFLAAGALVASLAIVLPRVAGEGAIASAEAEAAAERVEGQAVTA
jgi:MFS family permease